MKAEKSPKEAKAEATKELVAKLQQENNVLKNPVLRVLKNWMITMFQFYHNDLSAEDIKWLTAKPNTTEYLFNINQEQIRRMEYAKDFYMKIIPYNFRQTRKKRAES